MDRGTWQLSYPSRKVMCVLVARSCLTLCDPTDCSPPGFSVHEILQARILAWVAVPFCRGSSRPRDQIRVSCVKIKYHYMKITCRNGNLDSILKSRDITLPTKVHLVKAMVYPAVIYRCESWTIKKAEHQRIDAFELWC